MTHLIKEEKQYGLIAPGKNRLTAPKPGNVFGEDSGSDGDDGSDWVRKALRAEGEKNLVKKQTQLTMKRALKEDPTVYQYDEVYDDIERSKIEEKSNKKTVEKKAKYIENLMKAADRRKREQEHRVERMVQKEREAEGAMFADKESFVTSAYRAKLEEFKKMEDEEKRMDRLEAIGDVTKQQDMSGFYRHLYHQTVDPDKNMAEKDKIKITDEVDESRVKEKSKGETLNNAKDNIDGDDPLSTDSEDNSVQDDESNLARANEVRINVGKGTKRQYRKRMADASQSSSEEEVKEEKSVPKSSVAERVTEVKEVETEKAGKVLKKDHQEQSVTAPALINQHSSDEKSETKAPIAENVTKGAADKAMTEPKIEAIKTVIPEAPKISIWEKRTVGPVFEAALARYYARKSAMSSG
ncbi:nuclear speckle splicing regulatory protein 1 [Athalia rosae]|uniref:nuclear speckle splicing regulatory protein 1 n=1 Tax=Athalia rosae TaxID=37344 RepID=UPI0020336023|nr:nuclear speckle splicing regulatory protein 1 [Athalia rosae]